MKTAEIVSYPEVCSMQYTRNPEARTVLMAVKKERRRIEKVRQERDARRVASGRFNSIRGLDKLGRY